MQALILAAGRGSRLRELTDDRPKCLVPLAGKPLLRWQYDALRAAGARQVLVVRGYLAERLVPEAAGLPSGAFATVDNPRWAQCNMLASLLCAGPWLDAAFAGEAPDGPALGLRYLVCGTIAGRTLLPALPGAVLTRRAGRRLWRESGLLAAFCPGGPEEGWTLLLGGALAGRMGL